MPAMSKGPRLCTGAAAGTVNGTVSVTVTVTVTGSGHGGQL